MKFPCVVASQILFALALLAGQVRAQDVDGQVEQIYGQAKALESSGHVDLAIRKYQEIIHLRPNLASAYNNLGRLYYQEMQLDEAISTLKRACALAPKLEAPRALLGFSFYQQGNFEDARRELAKAELLNPEDINAELYLARSLIQVGELRAARELLEKIDKQDPRNEDVLYLLGTLYSTLAESAFTQIQANNPNSYLLELLLGQAAEAKQVFSDAAEHYRQAIERAPEVAELYYHYGHALWQVGNLQDAVKAYRHDLSLNPYDDRAAWEIARIVLADNPEEAHALTSRSLKIRPDNPNALLIRGQASLSLDKPTDAVEDLKKANSIDPENESVHFQLARAYRKLGLNQEAQDELSTFKQLQRKSHEQTERAMQEQLRQQQLQPANSKAQ
jgi:tetratricopeptide (TPR) repeat protein